MSIENGIIKDPIDVEDVSRTLGEGDDTGTCCTSPNVNKWSKYKPFRYPSVATPGDSERGNSTYNWGMDITNAKKSSTGQLKTESWVWDKPSQHFRITDFVGYDHNAAKPIPSLGSQRVNIYGKTQYVISTSQEVVSQTEIANWDLKLGETALANCYLGVMLRQGNTRFYFTNSSPGIITDITFTPAQGSALSTGTYEGLLFASDRALTTLAQQQTSTSGNFLVLDQPIFSTITIVSEAGITITIALSARKLQGTTSANRRWNITGTVTYANNSGSIKVFSQLRLLIEKDSNQTSGSTIASSVWDETTSVPNGTSIVKRLGGRDGGDISVDGSYTTLYAYATAVVDGVTYNSGHQMIMMSLDDITT